MKQMTEAELLVLLTRAYNQGFEDAIDGVHNAAHVDDLEVDKRNEYLNGMLADV